MSTQYRIMGTNENVWVRTLHTATGEPLPESLCPHFPDVTQARNWIEARRTGAVLEAIEQGYAIGKNPRTSRNLARETGLSIARVRFALRTLQAANQIEDVTVHYNRTGPLAHAPGWIPCSSTRARITNERAQHAADCEGGA